MTKISLSVRARSRHIILSIYSSPRQSKDFMLAAKGPPWLYTIFLNVPKRSAKSETSLRFQYSNLLGKIPASGHAILGSNIGIPDITVYNWYYLFNGACKTNSNFCSSLLCSFWKSGLLNVYDWTSPSSCMDNMDVGQQQHRSVGQHGSCSISNNNIQLRHLFSWAVKRPP